MTQTSSASPMRYIAMTIVALFSAALCALAVAPARAMADTAHVLSVTAPTSICSISTYDGSLALPTEDKFKFVNNSSFSVGVSGWETTSYVPFVGEATKADAMSSGNKGSWWVSVRANQGSWRTLSQSTPSPIDVNYDTSWKMKRAGSTDSANQNKPTDVLKIDSMGWVAANQIDGETDPSGAAATLSGIGLVELDAYGGVQTAFAATSSIPVYNTAAQKYAPLATVAWNFGPVRHSLTYDLNDGSNVATWSDGSKDARVISVFEGLEVDRPTDTPTRAGYVFAGWNTKADGSGADWRFEGGSLADLPEDDLTLYASWVQNDTAWAVYSATDNSLTFVRTASPTTVPTSSDIGGKTVTSYWGGNTVGQRFETETYASSANLPWASVLSNVVSVEIKDSVAPKATDWWFSNMPNLTSVSGFENMKMKGWSTTSMKGMFSYSPNLTSLDLSGIDVSSVVDMSNMFESVGSSLSSINIEGWDTRAVKDMSCMFYMWGGMLGDAAMDDILKNVRTDAVENMGGMFGGLTNVTTLDLSRFDTSKVKDMSYMFYYCTGLTSLDVSEFDTSAVGSDGTGGMSGMFYYCSSLASLSVSNFDTAYVRDMSWMFNNCTGLTELDLSSFDTSLVTSMSNMFADCKSLNSISFGSTFNTSLVTDMSSMFLRCRGLRALDVSGFSLASCTNVSHMFDLTGCYRLDLSAWNTSNVSNFTDMFGNSVLDTTAGESLFTAGWLREIFTGPGWLYTSNTSSTQPHMPHLGGTGFWSIGGTNNTFCTSSNYSTTQLLVGARHYVAGNNGASLTARTRVRAALRSNGDLCITTTAFYGTGYADSLAWNGGTGRHNFARTFSADQTTVPGYPNKDSTWNQYTLITNGTSSAPDVWTTTAYSATSLPPWHAAAYRTKIKRVLIQMNIDMRNMQYWFYDLPNLEEIRCSGWSSIAGLDTTYLTSTACAFANCPNLKTIDGRALGIGSSVTNVSGMFSGDSSLAEMSVSGWNVTNVTNAASMFKDCTSLQKVTGIDGWNLANVTTIKGMFDGCASLEDVGIAGIKSTVISDMSNMFRNCASLEQLDLSSLTCNATTIATDMLTGCASLITMNTGSGFTQSANPATFPQFSGATTSWIEEGVWTNKADGDAIPTGAATWVAKDAPVYGVLDAGGTLHIYQTGSAAKAQAKVVSQGKTVVGVDQIAVNSTLNWSNSNTVYQANGWESAITSVTIHEPIAFIPNSLGYMFCNLPNLKDIDGLDKINTSQCTDFSNMFMGCNSLESVDDVKDWDTSSGVNFAHMFEDCSSLDAVDLSGWDTSNGANFEYMFSGCARLATLTYPGTGQLVTSTGTNMFGMFKGCSSMTSFDQAKYDVSNVTNFGELFSGCDSIAGLLDLSQWNTTNANNMGNIFSGCMGIGKLKVGSGWGWSAVANVNPTYQPTFPSAEFYNGAIGPYTEADVVPAGVAATYSRYITSWLWDAGSSTLAFKYASAAERAAATDAGALDLGGYASAYELPWSSYLASVDKVVFGGTQVIRPSSLAYWFDGMTNVTSFDFTKLDVPYVNNWTRTFAGVATGVSGGISLDLSGWGIGNANTMAGMFDGANISSLKIGAGWHYSDSVYADKSLQPTFPDASAYGGDSYHLNGSDSYYEATSANCAHIPTVTGLPTLQLTYTRGTKPAGGSLFTMSVPSGGNSLMAGSIAQVSLGSSGADPGGGEPLAEGASSSSAEAGGPVGSDADESAQEAAANTAAASALGVSEGAAAESGADSLALDPQSADLADSARTSVEPSWLYDDGAGALTFAYATAADRAAADVAGVLNLIDGCASVDEVPWRAHMQDVKMVVFDDTRTIAPISLAHWFEGAVNMTSIDFGGLDFPAVTDWTDAFKNCSIDTVFGVPAISGLNMAQTGMIANMFNDTYSAVTGDSTDGGSVSGGIGQGSGNELGTSAATVEEPPSAPDEGAGDLEPAASEPSDNAAPAEADEHPPEAVSSAAADAAADAPLDAASSAATSAAAA